LRMRAATWTRGRARQAPAVATGPGARAQRDGNDAIDDDGYPGRAGAHDVPSERGSPVLSERPARPAGCRGPRRGRCDRHRRAGTVPAVVSTGRADGSIQSSVINADVLPHPIGTVVVGVGHGRRPGRADRSRRPAPVVYSNL
jgi:hypothetical protein